MDKFGGVVILSEICFGPGQMFPWGSQKAVQLHSRELQDVCALWERGTGTCYPVLQRKIYLCFWAHTAWPLVSILCRCLPSTFNPWASIQITAPPRPWFCPCHRRPTLIVTVVLSPLSSISWLVSFLKHFLLLASGHHIFYLSLGLFFDSFPSQLSDLLKTEGPRAHGDFRST